MNVPSSMILISPFVMLCCRFYSRYPSCLGLSWSHYPSCSTLCRPAGCSLRFQRLGHCSYTFLPGNHRCSHQLRHVEAVVTANMLKCKQLFGSIVLCDRQMGKEWYICSNQLRNMCWLLLSISQLRMKMGRAVGFAVDIYKTKVGLFTVNLAMSIVSLWSVVYASFRFSVL